MATEIPPENRRHPASARSMACRRVAPSLNPWRQGGRQKQTCRQTLRRHLPEMVPLFHLAFPAFRSDGSPAMRSPTLSDTGLVDKLTETSFIGAMSRTQSTWKACSVEPAFQRPAWRSARRFEGRFHYLNDDRAGSFWPLICVNIGRWRGSKHPNIAAIGTLKRRPKRPSLRMEHRTAGPG